MADLKARILRGRPTKDMNFHERVWTACARIPRGKVATYSDLAAMVDSPSAARAVGQAMNRNPFAPDVPCHRVVGATGGLTGYAGGLDKKTQMLTDEGVEIANGKVNLKKHRWRPR